MPDEARRRTRHLSTSDAGAVVALANLSNGPLTVAHDDFRRPGSSHVDPSPRHLSDQAGIGTTLSVATKDRMNEG
jgi:hypothetical protein